MNELTIDDLAAVYYVAEMCSVERLFDTRLPFMDWHEFAHIHPQNAQAIRDGLTAVIETLNTYAREVQNDIHSRNDP